MADEKLKKRIVRCIDILSSIWAKRGVNRKTLAQAYGCSIRTIADDIQLLKTIGFPIRYQKTGYTISVKDLKIPPLPLNEEQLLSLFIASQLLVLTPLEQKADAAVQQMLSVLSEEAVTFLRDLTDRVYIAPGGDLGDTKILFDVYRAVSECRSIRIRYQALSTQQEETHDVDPYGIYIKDRARSYLLGYSYGQYQNIRCFKLCRILELKFRRMQFSYPSDFSIRKEMEKGFWDGDQEYEVVLRFHPEIAQLVKEREPEKYITVLPGGYVQIRKMVRNPDEVFYDLLRYGKRAEVLKPEELRQRVKEELREWKENYKA